MGAMAREGGGDVRRDGGIVIELILPPLGFKSGVKQIIRNTDANFIKPGLDFLISEPDFIKLGPNCLKYG
jgi:hypothetical protein